MAGFEDYYPKSISHKSKFYVPTGKKSENMYIVVVLSTFKIDTTKVPYFFLIALLIGI